ncbi:hypothetical protein B9479_005923 [Cryptococcus floricola]|uniref:Uncharacterized protein n=1 Tax=Cryptococcus floricola TaxID=2591691 RepID=A0A5D3AUG2_9TREE|nr:hypothetical protein B9479_005923 [Cryptococcus floricola]
MSSHAQTYDGDVPQIDEEYEETGMSLLRRGYEYRDALLVSSAVSKHGSKSYGAKTLSEIRDSVDKTCETGTALIYPSQIAQFAPPILLYPEGPFEVLSPGLMSGCMFTNKPKILVHRTLQSLDGVPTPFSEADYQSLKHAVKSEIVASENWRVKTIASGYRNVLNALETARVTQLEDGDGENDAMFKLDLSSVPYSMQFRKSGLSVNEDPGKELASWAWDKVTKSHEEGEGPSNGVTIVKLEEDLKSEHPLTSKNPLFFNSRKMRERLTARLRRMEEVDKSGHEIEFDCVFDTTPVARHTRLDFTPHDDEFSVRFERTEKHCVDREQWMHDALMLATVKNRDLSKMETHALIPSRHLENYTRATNDKLSLSAYRKKDVSRRPSDYIQVDDREFRRWRDEFFATHSQGESLLPSTLPREGHESLLKDVALISEGKGPEVVLRRYGEEDDGAPHRDTIAEFYGNVNPLWHYLKKPHRDAPLDAVQLEDGLTPAALDRWTEVKEDQVGTPAEGQDLLAYRDWLVNQNI